MKPINIKNFYYNYKVKLYKKTISSVNSIERNYHIYINDNIHKTIDIKNNIFSYNKLFLKRKAINSIKYMKQIEKLIEKSDFRYDAELNFYYFKTKKIGKIFSCNNGYYELELNCYDSKKKIGQTINYKFKRLKIKELLYKIKTIESILNQKVDHKIMSIEEEELIITSFAFSQILSFYKRIIWKNRNELDNSNFILSIPKGCFSYNSIFYNKKGETLRIKELKRTTKYSDIAACTSFIFFNKNKTNNIERKLSNGYVITKMYFLNNNDNNSIKAMCSGYYIKNNIPINVFSNKLYSFNLIELLNNIKFVSKKRVFSNDFMCPDIYIKSNKPSL